MAVGQAAGTAAAIAVKSSVSPRQVAGGRVQAALRTAGAWPDYMKRVPDNLALKRNGTNAQADSVLDRNTVPTPDGAIDGLIIEGSQSRWVSGESPCPHWLTLTFARPETVRRVVLHFWAPDNPKEALHYTPAEYQIQADRDGQWTDLVAERTNQKLDPEYAVSAVTTPRLRLYVTKVRGNDTIVRLREIEVY
jgi:hypothetical protein